MKAGIRFYKRFSPPRWMILAIDLLIVFSSFFLAYQLRFNFSIAGVRISAMVIQAYLALATYFLSMVIFQSYAGLIRHTTVKDIFSLFLANTISVLVLAAISYLARIVKWDQVLIIPLSILIIHYILATLVLSLSRMIIKIAFESLVNSQANKKNVLIFGAGAMGVITKRIIESDRFSGYRIIGYIDDNRKLRGKTVNQHPIYSAGMLDRKLIEKEKIRTLIIAVKNLSKERKALLVKKSIDLDLEVLEVPTVDRWFHGSFSPRQLRKIEPEDLLGRDPIVLNTAGISAGLDGKTVLVTGAAGSIGSELTRQLAEFPNIRLVLVDQAETPVFYLKNEIEKNFSNVNATFILADVTNRILMENIFGEYHPEIVFHAAAYKHVPLMESNPHESIRVNIGGTKTVADTAVKFGAEKFVMISSDKAVNPANVMGASKRLCEIYVQSLSSDSSIRTQFVTTRFGNVLGSNGSVIPLFKRQIEKGGPVTVTHREITRFFMTIPEACQLVLEAAFLGRGGEIFVFDMGKPVKIYDLAKQMIKLSGFIPDEEIEINITGLRPGEKLYEELLSSKERTLPTHHPKIMIARNGMVENRLLRIQIEDLLNSLYFRTREDIVATLMALVPEFTQPVKMQEKVKP